MLAYNVSVVRSSNTYIPRVRVETTYIERPPFPPIAQVEFVPYEQEQKLQRQPDFFANVSLGYDFRSFSARLSVFHQDAYTTSFAANTARPATTASAAATRASTSPSSRPSADRLRLLLNVNNLTGVEERALSLQRRRRPDARQQQRDLRDHVRPRTPARPLSRWPHGPTRRRPLSPSLSPPSHAPNATPHWPPRPSSSWPAPFTPRRPSRPAPPTPPSASSRTGRRSTASSTATRPRRAPAPAWTGSTSSSATASTSWTTTSATTGTHLEIVGEESDQGAIPQVYTTLNPDSGNPVGDPFGMQGNVTFRNWAMAGVLPEERSAATSQPCRPASSACGRLGSTSSWTGSRRSTSRPASSAPSRRSAASS